MSITTIITYKTSSNIYILTGVLTGRGQPENWAASKVIEQGCP